MVAEDRFNLLIKLDSPSLIDLGNWQIELGRAIKEYLEKTKEVFAANDRVDRVCEASPSISDA